MTRRTVALSNPFKRKSPTFARSFLTILFTNLRRKVLLICFRRRWVEQASVSKAQPWRSVASVQAVTARGSSPRIKFHAKSPAHQCEFVNEYFSTMVSLLTDNHLQTITYRQSLTDNHLQTFTYLHSLTHIYLHSSLTYN